MPSLHGPRLKLGRAEEHLSTIKAIIQRFLESNPYSFILQPNPNPPDYVLRANINQVPPIQLSCIVGDFAHNARSALDLLVYQLSDLVEGDKNRLKLQFPIFNNAVDYSKNEKAYLSGVKPEYKTIIERHQPYKRPQRDGSDALTILQSINNTDKHRLINVVGAIANLDYFNFDSSSGLPDNIKLEAGAHIRVGQSFNFGNGFTGSKIGNGAITKDNAIVAKLTIPQPEKVKVTPDYHVAIQFYVTDQTVNGRPVVDTLTLIYDGVNEIIRDFEPFFHK